MDKQSLIEKIESIILETTESTAFRNWILSGQILMQYAGKNSKFYKEYENSEFQTLREQRQLYNDEKSYLIKEIMGSYIDYLKSGVDNGMPIEQKAELDTLSRILNQAEILMQDNNVNPAVISIIIGAALEDYLRCWVGDINKMDEIKGDGSIEKYKSVLYANRLIEKHEMKNIEAIAARRNEAAHGNWDKVGNKESVIIDYERVKLIIEKRHYPKNHYL